MKPARAMIIFMLFMGQIGCATGKTKQIAIGMLTGAAVGAVVGHEFIHHGRYKEFETRNTLITSALFALVTGAVLAWHYDEMQQQMVEVSGRYARYRLCNPDEMNPELAQKLGAGSQEGAVQLQPEQIQKLSISLDDNTKWVYPLFRKRFLPPERDESQVISTRYIWEILKPGSFVTRTQDPKYFIESDAK